MDDYISVDGLALPNKPLTNFELVDFRGVFMRNNLPSKPRKRECGILNLDGVSGRGTHWVTWHKVGEDKFYLDSFGVQPPRELVRYLGVSILQHGEGTAGRSSNLWAFMSVRAS